MKIFETVICIALIVCTIIALFTGGMTLEQLIAIGLTCLLVAGVSNEIRDHVKRKIDETEEAREE